MTSFLNLFNIFNVFLAPGIDFVFVYARLFSIPTCWIYINGHFFQLSEP